MFSKLVLKYLRKTVEDGHKWGCLPYKWDRSNSSIVITVRGSRTRKYLWYFNIGSYTLHMVYLFGRYMQRQLDASSVRTKIAAEYVLLVYVLPLVIRWCIFLRYEELADFLNSSLKLFRGLKPSQEQRQARKHPPRSRKAKVSMKAAAFEILENNRSHNTFDVSNNNIHAINELETPCQDHEPTWPKEKDSLFSFFVTTAFVIRWLDVLNAFTRPELDNFFTSLLPNSGTSTPIWQRALLAIPLVYIWWTTWAVLNFTLVYCLVYVRATVVTIAFAKDLSKRNGGHEQPWTSFRKIYRCLQLLQGKQDDAMGYMVSAHKIILVFHTVRSFAIALSHLEEGGLLAVPIVMGCSAWVYLHCAFQLFGSIYEESSECLQEWKGAQRAPRWFRTTFIRSCWPLKIYVGGMYYADRQMSLTLNIEILSKIVETVLAS